MSKSQYYRSAISQRVHTLRYGTRALCGRRRDEYDMDAEKPGVAEACGNCRKHEKRRAAQLKLAHSTAE